MPNPFHDPQLAPIVRAVTSRTTQTRPALICADDLQRVRVCFAGYLQRFESLLETQTRNVDLSQARTNCQSALSYIDAIAFDLTAIDKGIVTALLGWLENAVQFAEMIACDTGSSDDDQAERVREILQALQTALRA